MTKANNPYRTKAEAIHRMSRLDATSFIYPEDAFNLLHPYRATIAPDAEQDFERDLELREAIARECDLAVDIDPDLGVKPWTSVVPVWRVSALVYDAVSGDPRPPAGARNVETGATHEFCVRSLANREGVEVDL